ncbi:hypothetical protein GH714_000213 [Hevea brasiliensis]|uniref:Uncharacterized protein n=1 Tax=Hevea brasiliensis TaxID=3981 RepID=A0A6A6L5D3_HEVBR|nr:hypothetical protein GH714_000213 [Hevea brasiliensis]
MEEITGSLGWPIVGESFSFITEFSSSPGIHSFMKKRQERRSIDKSNQREQEEQTLHGCKIKKGWSINLDVVSIHHDPEVFPDLQRWRTMEKDDSVQPTLERMPKNKYPIVVKSL